jgi:Peptidase family M23
VSTNLLVLLLMLTTILRRLALPMLLFLTWTPVAHAWSWPVQGPVVQGFAYDNANPYASGQHRGIDIGADASGESVIAPASGTVSFAGTVPTNGKSITIETQDGYSVTLTHLGSLLVAKGALVAEGVDVGTIGPSGTPEVDGPYVHLGVRTTTDPNGYLDPLTFLPPPAESEPAQSTPPPVAQPAPSSAAPSQPAASQSTASQPATSAPATTEPSAVPKRGKRLSRAASRPQRPAHRPAVRPDVGTSERTSRMQRRARDEPKSAPQRPAVEVPARTVGVALGAGHEIPQTAPAKHVRAPQPSPTSALQALALNGAATLVALLAALVAGRRRRRSIKSGAEILHLPRPQPARRAA